MTNEEAVKWRESFKAWLSIRPECIQKLAVEYPYGMFLCYLNSVAHYVIGWTENDLIIVAPMVPWNSAEVKRQAIRQSSYISAAAARMGKVLQVDRHAA